MPGLSYVGHTGSDSSVELAVRREIDTTLAGDFGQNDLRDMIAQKVGQDYLSQPALDQLLSSGATKSYVDGVFGAKVDSSDLGKAGGLAKIGSGGVLPASYFGVDPVRWNGPWEVPITSGTAIAFRNSNGTHRDVLLGTFTVPARPDGLVHRPLIFGMFEGYPSPEEFGNLDGRAEVYATSNNAVSAYGSAHNGAGSSQVWPIVVMPNSDVFGQTASGWSGAVTVRIYFRTAFSGTAVTLAGTRKVIVYSVPA